MLTHEDLILYMTTDSDGNDGVYCGNAEMDLTEYEKLIRNKAINEAKQVIEVNLGGDAWVTIKQVLNNELDKLKGGSDED